MIGWWLTALTLAAAPTAPFECHPRGGIGNVFAKLAAGEEVAIGYVGGSITNGSGASEPRFCWRETSFAWFGAQFPGAKLTQVHTASGGTGAALGAARLKRQYLDHGCDLLFVEFAVNDAGLAPNKAVDTVEGIVRQARQADPSVEIILLYTFTKATAPAYDRGECPPTVAAHERVAEHYDLPSINVGYPAWQRISGGQMSWEQFAGDGVHPTDAGYAIYTEVVARALAAMPRPTAVTPHALPEPLSATNWQAAGLVSIADLAGDGWGPIADDGKRRRWEALWPAVREGGPGATLRFRFSGTAFGLYDVMAADSGQIRVTVDGRMVGIVNRWDSYCLRFDRAAATILADDLAPGEHTVELTVAPTKHEQSTGTAIRIGDVILVGRLLE